MRVIADFHLHSRYSRATSPDMTVETIARWAHIKGIGLVGTGDFTHPLYLASLKAKLEPEGTGLLVPRHDGRVHFLLTTEVSNIYHEAGHLRKIHTLLFAPSFEVVEKINRALRRFGDLASDGRPTCTFPVRDLVRLVYDISDDCLIVPAHVWTPWFSVFGSRFGFDSLEECFGEETARVSAIETGLSSDPEMNRRVSALDAVTLISNSDAHSPSRLGREANVFDCPLTYADVVTTIKTGDPARFLFTIEFYPQEGKYHYDGHRACGIRFAPEETRAHHGVCPVCQRPLTVGVLNRVEALADRDADCHTRPAGTHLAIPARHLVPLEEILAEAMGVGVGTISVRREYERLIAAGGAEFRILLDLPREDLLRFTPPQVVEGVVRAREGRVRVIPGYDGVYGKVHVLSPERMDEASPTVVAEQRSLF